ncbi:MAG: hypothetical protein SFZ03_00990 [Candidatus Melainabacteria bacterium]|nr:hypothetical protein [Candidatus Melainabacteria bacterium]
MPGQEIGPVNPAAAALNAAMQARPELRENGAYVGEHPILGKVVYVNTDGNDSFTFVHPGGEVLTLATQDSGNNNIYGEEGEIQTLGINGEPVASDSNTRNNALELVGLIFGESTNFQQVATGEQVEEQLSQPQ